MRARFTAVEARAPWSGWHGRTPGDPHRSGRHGARGAGRGPDRGQAARRRAGLRRALGRGVRQPDLRRREVRPGHAQVRGHVRRNRGGHRGQRLRDRRTALLLPHAGHVRLPAGARPQWRLRPGPARVRRRDHLGGGHLPGRHRGAGGEPSGPRTGPGAALRGGHALPALRPDAGRDRPPAPPDQAPDRRRDAAPAHGDHPADHPRGQVAGGRAPPRGLPARAEPGAGAARSWSCTSSPRWTC